MTNRKINKAIAEYLGWKELDFHSDGKHIIGDRPSFHKGKIVSYTVDQYVPDYCGDLNEMHEAEKILFTMNNWEACTYETALQTETTSWAWHATAKQRAKVFLKTIGKWTE